MVSEISDYDSMTKKLNWKRMSDPADYDAHGDERLMKMWDFDVLVSYDEKDFSFDFSFSEDYCNNRLFSNNDHRGEKNSNSSRTVTHMCVC